MLFTPNHCDPISCEDHTRDLGILVDTQANSRPQRIAVIKKVKAKAAWVLRVFRSHEPALMRRLWRTLIQPHQDYGSQLWSPAGLLGDLELQEPPLRTFTKRVRGLHGTQ